MKIGYLDCPSGISGDMFLGALVDCGVPLDAIRESLAHLPIQGFEITSLVVNKAGLTATQVEVHVDDQVTERRLAEIVTIVSDSALPENIKGKAVDIFRRIGGIEAKIHGVEVETVHLHELGGLDTIVDVVGVLLGLDRLGIERLIASPLPLGSGTIQSAHGTLPLPAPATLALLEGVPVYGSDYKKELVTPTGAALVTSLAHGFGNLPAMRLEKTGYGAGKRDLPTPNVLRLLIGEGMEQISPVFPFQAEILVCLECNIDNMNPEIYPYLSERLFTAGALDVSFIPIYMKKNRPGTLVKALCAEQVSEDLMEIILSESTTLGIRKSTVERYSVERRIKEVTTPYGMARVKFSNKGKGGWDYSPEYEDCRRLALQHSLPIKKIYRTVEIAAEDYLKNLDTDE
jgi:hypothetical protein